MEDDTLAAKGNERDEAHDISSRFDFPPTPDPSTSRSQAKRIFLLGASPSLQGSGVFPISPGEASDLSAERLKKTGGNSGNQVIAYGLLKALNYSSVSWDHSIGPERVNSEYDVIVIAAANFLHTGFDFSGMASFIEATNLPCTMVGVGAQSNDYSTDIKLQPGTDRLMRVVSERSKLIGARGQFTGEVLAKMGIHNVQVTGCPSYYMNCKPDLIVRKPPLRENPLLLMNSSRDVVRHAFDRERMIDVVCQLTKIAVETNADFVAQSEMPEIRIADATNDADRERNFRAVLKEFPFFDRVGPLDDLERWFKAHAKVFWDVDEWLKAAGKYDFAFGNRFHGSIIAIQAGTPACVICHDTRTAEMCEFLGVPSLQLKDADNLNVSGLYSRVDPEAIQARYSVIYPLYRAFLATNDLPDRLD